MSLFSFRKPETEPAKRKKTSGTDESAVRRKRRSAEERALDAVDAVQESEAPRNSRPGDTGRTTVPPAKAAASAFARSALLPLDAPLVATVLALIAFGVVMVFSASAVYAEEELGDGMRFLVRQTAFAFVAVPVMLTVANIDYRRFRPLTYPILLSTVVLLILTLAIGRTAGGATRWIRVGPVDIQAAELAKLAIVFFLAHSLSKKADRITQFSIGVLPHLVVMGVLALLCLLQPDLGSALMLGMLTFVLLFAAGAKIGPILGALGGLAAAGALAIFTSPWRMARVEAFLDPFAHREGAGYQIVESIVAFGSGGVYGVGIGDSRQKLFYLPEAHTDFIGAIVAEELGFVGVMVLLSAFLMIGWRGVRAAWRAPDDYGSWLAIGATALIVLSAFFNLAVVMGLLPTKGLTLPFVSYGGSSLVVCATAIGVILSVARAPALAGQASKGTSGKGAEDEGSKTDVKTDGSDAARANAVRKSKAA
jgi:cell division protein FtsW